MDDAIGVLMQARAALAAQANAVTHSDMLKAVKLSEAALDRIEAFEASLRPGFKNSPAVKGEIMRYGCFNRNELASTALVQSGWSPEGTRIVQEVPVEMAKACQYTRTVLGLNDARCVGCKHKGS